MVIVVIFGTIIKDPTCFRPGNQSARNSPEHPYPEASSYKLLVDGKHGSWCIIPIHVYRVAVIYM
jgi:hypothetical protein